jgi:hypothetical protein
MSFIYRAFLFFPLLVQIWVGKVRFRERSTEPEAREKGRILAEA